MNSDSLSELPQFDVNKEILKILICINDMTLKIKRELNEIHKIVEEKGQLSTAVNNANNILFNVALEKGITMDDLLKENEGESELQSNSFYSIEPNLITEKIMSLINN